MSILTVNNLKKLYFSHEVLEDVSFTLDRNDKMAIVGANGAGKTTLMRILTGKESGRRIVSFCHESGLCLAIATDGGAR